MGKDRAAMRDRDYVDRQVRQVRDDINALITGMHEVGVRTMADYEVRLRGALDRLTAIEQARKAEDAESSSSRASWALWAAAVGGPVVSAVATWLATRGGH